MALHDTMTVRIWHGGQFEHVSNGDLAYVDGESRTFDVDSDLLSYWELVDMAKVCGDYSKIDGVYYLVSGLNLTNGLREVFTDDVEVLEMIKLASKCSVVDVYVTHSQVESIVEPNEINHVSEQNIELLSKKLTPKRVPPKSTMPTRCSPIFKNSIVGSATDGTTKEANLIANPSQKTHVKEKDSSRTPSKSHPTQYALSIQTNKGKTISNPRKSSQPSSSKHTLPQTQKTVPPSPSQKSTLATLGEYEWEDNRPDSPLTLHELLGYESESTDEVDPTYKPESNKPKNIVKFLGDVYDDVEDTDEDLDLESLHDLEVEGLEDDDELLDHESDTSDDEYKTARDRVWQCSIKLKEIAEQVVRDAAELNTDQQREAIEHVSKEGEYESGYISEYEDNGDDIHTPPSSGDEGTNNREKRGVLVNPDSDFSQFRWKVGQRFATKEGFKEAVAKYAILHGRDVHIVVSNSNKGQQLGIKCVEGCPFYLYISWHSRAATFIVKKVVDEHSCHRNMKKNRQLKSPWVAKQLLEVFKSRPHWPAKEIVETVRRAYKVIVQRPFAYKVKYYAHKMLHGSMKDHYNKLGRYIKALKESSPNTKLDLVTVQSKANQPPEFRRLFTCFEGLQRGWREGCRRVICVDAYFVKTFLGGQLLSAVGRDGNEQMYPIAWAAVEGENNLSWEWFFINLKECLNLEDGAGISIISDEHQAILNAVATVLPGAEHRHCARHIFALWHKSFRGDELKLKFWKIAKAYNMADFNEALDELTEINAAAAAAFKGYNPPLFCRAYLDSSMRTDAITNNMAETFNGYIINARTKHLIYMLEDIRVALMQRLVLKRQEMEKSSSILCPRIQSRLEKEKAKAAHCDVLPSTDSLFNVKYYLDQLIVDLDNRSCTCRKWDMLGIPCCHAIACIFFLNKEAESYVDEYYKREVYLRAYAGSIPPCPGERHWPRVQCNVYPPPIKIGPGRPRKNRIKDPYEDPKKPGTLNRIGMEMTCSICSVKGHNKRRCPNRDSAVPREPPVKKARGRPRLAVSAPSQQQQGPANASTCTSTGHPSSTVTFEHHTTSAQPTQLGRGGRMVLGGRGSRGGKATGRGRGATTNTTTHVGRGNGDGSRSRGRGRNQVPVGVGVVIGSDGSTLTSVASRGRRPKVLNLSQLQSIQQSQTSTLHQPTQ